MQIHPDIFCDIIQKSLKKLAQDECYPEEIYSQFSNFRMSCSVANLPVYEVMLFDMWNYIYSEIVFNTLRWHKTEILKKFPSDKIKVIKNAHFFSSASSNSSQFYF